MNTHAGALVEKVVRRSGISIAELARRIDVNRRSLYNWFEQPMLSYENIARIGQALGYDFSVDFPEYKNYKIFQEEALPTISITDSNYEDISYWKNKYITLLEKYNDVLIKQHVAEEYAA